MKKYRINTVALKALPKLTGSSVLAMANTIDVCSRDTLKRSLDRGDMRTDVFVALCNAYRLDPAMFFVENGEQMMLGPGCGMSEGVFEPVAFHPERIENYDGKTDVMKLSVMLDILPSRKLAPADVITGGPVEPDERVEVVDDAPVKASALCYNDLLMENLPLMLGWKQNDIGLKAGHSGMVYSLAVNSGNIVLRTLVAVCNATHVNIRHFFVADGKRHIPENLVTPDDEWQPIEYHPERLKLLYARGNPYGYSCNGILEVLGYAKTRWLRILGENSPLRARDLCHMCNRLHFDPMMLFDAPEVFAKTNVTSVLQVRIDRLTEELHRKNVEIRRLQSQLENTRELLEMAQRTNAILSK